MHKRYLRDIIVHPIIFIFAAVIIGVLGQLFIKLGLNALGNINFSSGYLYAYSKIFLSPMVIFGIVIYFLSSFFWLYALANVDLSFAYPFLALSYVLILLISWIALGESISMVRWIGVLVICLGVFIISRS